MSTVQITCSTPDSQIYYTLDGNDPTENSNLYSSQFEVTPPLTVKAKAYKEGYDSSDIASFKVLLPITVPMTLPDGSVLFYDRGEQYGSYSIGLDGYPKRDDGLVDDETLENINWRYLVLANDQPKGILSPNPGAGYSNLAFCEYDTQEYAEKTTTEIGAGLPNTNVFLPNFENSTSSESACKELSIKRKTTGQLWFFPSKDELYLAYQSKIILRELTGLDLDYTVFSSSVISHEYVWVAPFGKDNSDMVNMMTDGNRGEFVYVRRI